MGRRYYAFAIVVSSLASLLAADVRVACAQTAADLFDAGTLQELRLFINSKDLALLRAHYSENTKYPADLLWRNTRVRNVAVKSRGSGSRNANKLGIAIEFDHYTTGQQFLGLTSLVLDNAWQDPSMIREQVAMALFARMGLAAPRESFCRLYINGDYQGLYVIIEDIDTNLLSRTLGQNSGYLFEFHWQDVWLGTYLGDDLNTYKPRFEPRTHELETDSVLYGPIRDLLHEVNGPDDAVWRDRVEQLIDLQQFVKSVAVEVFLVEWDGLTGNWGINNFYLYRRAGGNRHEIIPWDRDHAMWAPPDNAIFGRANDNVLFQRAMTFSDLRSSYLDALQQCAELAAQDSWFESQVARSSSLIADAAHADTRKQWTNAEFDTETQFLMDFVRLRPAFVLQEVTKARPPQGY